MHAAPALPPPALTRASAGATDPRTCIPMPPGHQRGPASWSAGSGCWHSLQQVGRSSGEVEAFTEMHTAVASLCAYAAGSWCGLECAQPSNGGVQCTCSRDWCLGGAGCQGPSELLLKPRPTWRATEAELCVGVHALAPGLCEPKVNEVHLGGAAAIVAVLRGEVLEQAGRASSGQQVLGNAGQWQAASMAPTPSPQLHL